ncbi:hypothetical protein Fmac_024786 [Flemingia macrophylla]|uniref:Uncharacterized protein n=1 Tax=Flemingia macrophylla TaxID=520843 RepID=A0ABD1LQY2_9FABA
MGGSTRDVIRPRFFLDDFAPMSQSSSDVQESTDLPTFPQVQVVFGHLRYEAADLPVVAKVVVYQKVEGMDGVEIGGSRRVRSVKDAKPSSRTRELHRARRDTGRYKETRWTAESSKTETESGLSNAKKMVKDISSMIDESSNTAKTQMRYIERLEKWGKGQQGAVVVAKRNENYEYIQVMRELEYLKIELFKLKLDVASVMKDKSR